MKYIVEYSTGEYDSYYTHHYAVEAESVDEFHVKFLDAIEEWKVRAAEKGKLRKDLESARASKEPKKNEAAWKAWEDHCKSDTYYYGFYIVIDGMVFEFPDNDFDNKKQELTSLPEVYTLDEWFEQNRPVKAEGKAT